MLQLKLKYNAKRSCDAPSLSSGVIKKKINMSGATVFAKWENATSTRAELNLLLHDLLTIVAVKREGTSGYDMGFSGKQQSYLFVL